MVLGIMTSADLDKLPDIPGIRYEIIDGELHVSHQPTVGHQYVCTALSAPIHDWNVLTGAGLVLNAPGLVFADDQDVVPDLVWISSARLLDALDSSGHLRLAPEIVVEVLSPGPANELRDRRLKHDLYERRGVLEYWIADWRQHTIEIYGRDSSGLTLSATLGDNDTLTSPLLPGFSVAVSSLWTPLLN